MEKLIKRVRYMAYLRRFGREVPDKEAERIFTVRQVRDCIFACRYLPGSFFRRGDVLRRP
jgi:hypothetical protein